jgi:hypothetical protein
MDVIALDRHLCTVRPVSFGCGGPTSLQGAHTAADSCRVLSDRNHTSGTWKGARDIGTMLLSSQLYREAGLTGLLRQNVAAPASPAPAFIASPRCLVPPTLSPRTAVRRIHVCPYHYILKKSVLHSSGETPS